MVESSKLEERINNRRRKRWMRRARIAAPFAALPLLLATLILSVDIIEYEPQQPRTTVLKRTVEKPMSRNQASLAARSAIATAAVAKREFFDSSQTRAIDPDDAEQAAREIDEIDRHLPNLPRNDALRSADDSSDGTAPQ